MAPIPPHPVDEEGRGCGWAGRLDLTQPPPWTTKPAIFSQLLHIPLALGTCKHLWLCPCPSFSQVLPCLCHYCPHTLFYLLCPILSQHWLLWGPGSLSSSLLLWSLAQAGGQSPLGPLGVSFSWNTSLPRGGWAQGGTQGRWQALSLVSATTVRHTALASSQPHSRRSAAPWPCAPSGSVPVGPTWPQPGRRSR